jgi:glycosyltransferase involved in cell wall biosynthesis
VHLARAVVAAGSVAGSVISVVVPVRNGMPWLEDQLRALVDQECAGEWEVLVVDNGSTDESPTEGRGWADRSAVVRWMDASGIRGPGAARNAGVREARGDLLAFCDADDVVRPGWLSAVASALEDADLAAGVFDFWSLNGRPASTLQPAATRQLGFLPAGLGANLGVRRHAFEAVGGFAEELSIGEDIDLCWRLQLRGFRFEVASDAVVAKREHPGFAGAFRHGTAYGLSGPALFRRHRADGARPDLRGAARSWLWLIVRAPLLLRRTDLRDQWAHAAGVRTGRLRGSIRERVFFP